MTALSVAKNCDMIGSQDKVAFLTCLNSSQSDNVKGRFELHWAKVDDDGSADRDILCDDNDYTVRALENCKVSFKVGSNKAF